MKLKKILAAIAACAMTAAMLGMTVSAAEVEGGDETLEEEVEPEVEAEPEEEPEVEAEPEVAQNPQTGNSPIALAVIPVALAAAAVVAKKAK